MRFFKLILLLVIFYFSPLSAAEDKLRDKIIKNLRCLVCQGQSISDSNSDFAQTIKLVVKDLVKEGKSENEIYSFMADKYGDWIVYKPQFNKQNFILWLFPYVVLAGGALIIFHFIRKKKG